MEFSFPDRAGANGISAEDEVPDPPGAIFEKKVKFHKIFMNFVEFLHFHEIPHFSSPIALTLINIMEIKVF